MRPAQRAALAGVLNAHIVPGRLTAADLAAKIAEGGGRAVLKTVGGQDLIATKSGNAILLTSGSGTKAAVTAADSGQSTGVEIGMAESRGQSVSGGGEQGGRRSIKKKKQKKQKTY